MRITVQVKYLQIREGLFEYRRVVPVRLRPIIGKTAVTIPFSTSDRCLALERYPAVHREAEVLFRAAEAGPSADTMYERTIADLRTAGLIAKDAVEVAPVPSDYTAERERYSKAILKALADGDPSFIPMDGPLQPGELEALTEGLQELQRRSKKARHPLPGAYLIGEKPAYRLMLAQELGVTKPKHRLSQARDHYLAMRGNKANQRDLPKQCDLVIKALVLIVGKQDPTLDDLTIDVAEMFRKKMTEGGLAPASVRRRITTIKALINCYIKDKRLSKEVENNFIGLTVADPEGKLDKESRDALSLHDIRACVPFIHEKNVDIQDLWLLQMFTAARPKELSGLLWDDVDLDHATPHIWIRPNDLRRLKTKGSKRKVPLMGKALGAMIARKERRVDEDRAVFPRYSGPTGSETVSVLQIKAMKQAGVWVKALKVPFSLRHATRDWVVRKVNSSWAAHLLGHASEGQTGNYGSDDMLDKLAEHLTAALKAGGVWDYPVIHLKGDPLAYDKDV